MAKKKVTIKDIAREAGVTATSVSLALNNRPGLSLKTRQNIIRITEEMQYEPDLVARSMINKKSQTIGLLIKNVSDPFFAHLVEDVETVANDNGYSVIVSNVHNSGELEKKHIGMLIGRRVDGIIIASVNFDAPHIKRLVDREFPFVLINRRIYDETISDKVNHVIMDGFKAGYEAVTHLYRMGHDRIAILTGTLKSSANLEKNEGVKRAFRDHGIFQDPRLIIECNNSKEEAHAATRNLLRMEQPPTAIFAQDDNMALSAREALLERGISIPDEMALLGFDDIDVSSLTGIELSTIREKECSMARMGTELLIDIMGSAALNQESAISQTVLETELVIRKTCGFYLSGYVR